jgi:hypothetical protein
MPRPRKKERLSAISRLALVRAKVERAKQNILDMDMRLSELHGYIPGVQKKVSSNKRDPGQIHTYHVPFDTLAAAGDVLNNLRSALDHLISQLSFARYPRLTQKQLKTCAFPIYESATKYEKSRGRDIKFIHPDAVKLIDSMKPYKGGNYALWMLNELNNTSKHRLLLNVSRVVMCHADWVGEISLSTMFMYKLGRPQFSGIWGRPEVNDYILPTGQETIRKLRPHRLEALLPTLEYFTYVVDGVIKQFLPYLE